MPLARGKQGSDMNTITIGAVKGMDGTRLEL